MKKNNRNFILFLICLTVSGCPSSEKSEIDKATSLFKDGDYAAALDRFEELIPSQGSVARVGAGWSALRLNDPALANQYFADAALDSLVDGYAGWCAALWTTGSALQSNDKAAFVLRKDSHFELSFDHRINADHLIWIQASNYFLLGNYAATIERIQKLDADFTANLNVSNIAEILADKLESLGAAH